MVKLLLISFLISAAMVVSIYSLSVADVNDASINFNDYRGKKILIVNTATGNTAANQQLVQMQQLFQQNQDSLVVIAFPSNSFGHEPGTNAQIKSLMQGTYGATYPIAVKSWVQGDSANIVYQWLSSKLQNDMMNSKTIRDYQKYLVDGTGRLVAKFDSSVSPLNARIQDAINRY
jgi:glutathione peroxidase